MSARRRLLLAGTLAAVCACWPMCAVSPAAVVFEPFKLASGGPAGLQAEYAYEPAISADGRFVAFTGIVGSKSGVYRKDLATGELDPVVLGSGAGSPSISADGRFVSFTSSQDPTTGSTLAGGCTEVYVRDMQAESGAEGAYKIVSARSESAEPLKYEGSSDEVDACPGGGSASANRVAISADGSEVAFTVIGRSNLTGNAESTETPEDQVAVRNLHWGTPAQPDTTTLASVVEGSESPVPQGAALSLQPSLGHPQRPGGGSFPLSHDDGSTAAISADGNAVAWMGVNIARQVRVGGGGGQVLLNPEPAFQYAEPLWRRIAPGAEATRRVLAGENPGCPPNCEGGLDLLWDEQRKQSGEEPLGPQYGSFVAGWLHPLGLDLAALTPQLSANGETVAILSTQPDYGRLPEFGTSQTDREKTPEANAFVVNMAPGLTREEAITRLTEWGSPDFSETALDGSVNEIAISGDGSRVVFTTERNVFTLAPPALITAPVSQLKPAQLYEANLQAGTLALVSEGYNGEPADAEEGNGGVSAAALSEDGHILALASGSSNLASGSFNDGSAVFVTEELDPLPAPGVQSISPLPPGPLAEPGWSISATATPSSGGSLLIDVSVPGAGRLSASASAPVPVTVTASSSSGKRARTHAKASRRAARPAQRRRTVTVIEARQLARAATSSHSDGLLQLRLVPTSRYRSLTEGKAGLYATITVTFAASGHHALTQTLQASFPRFPTGHSKAKPSARKPRPRPKSSSRRGRA